ncbi:hypothetical protein AB0G79_20280 [Streptomyces sp. NPDC020807]|uniref:hypothetical protein n=1 Tax=Streptomyces sp. NPDC020807 TaxID=3155119 RepID=UPI0033E7C251
MVEVTAYTPERFAEVQEDALARLLEFLSAAGELGADITIKVHAPVPVELMHSVREAIEAPGFRFSGRLTEAVGHSGTSTVTVTAELA